MSVAFRLFASRRSCGLFVFFPACIPAPYLRATACHFSSSSRPLRIAAAKGAKVSNESTNLRHQLIWCRRKRSGLDYSILVESSRDVQNLFRRSGSLRDDVLSLWLMERSGSAGDTGAMTHSPSRLTRRDHAGGLEPRRTHEIKAQKRRIARHPNLALDRGHQRRSPARRKVRPRLSLGT